jgi:hypothetical protein
MIVHFHSVGRDKKTWSKSFGAKVTESQIAKEAKSSARLMSSDVDAITNDDGSSGDIIVGGWRTVGTFTIQKDA